MRIVKWLRTKARNNTCMESGGLDNNGLCNGYTQIYEQSNMIKVRGSTLSSKARTKTLGLWEQEWRQLHARILMDWGHFSRKGSVLEHLWSSLTM